MLFYLIRSVYAKSLGEVPVQQLDYEIFRLIRYAFFWPLKVKVGDIVDNSLDSLRTKWPGPN